MICLIISLLLKSVRSSNVDVESPIIIRGLQSGSYFGYSTLLHQLPSSESPTSESTSEVVYLVGAPKANTTQNLVNPGAVYKCRAAFTELKTTTSCDEWLSVFDGADDETELIAVRDLDTNTISEELKLIETKSGQLFGTTLTKTLDSIVSCGHQYKDHYKLKQYQIERKLPIGRCSLISHDLTERQGFLVPCVNQADDHSSYGSCQAGASIAHHDGKLTLSAPFANNGLGNSFLYTHPLSDKKEDVLEALTMQWRGTGAHDGMGGEVSDYGGYSSVFCDVNGDGVKELVLGMPRAANYKGSIRVHIASIEEQERILRDFETFQIPEILLFMTDPADEEVDTMTSSDYRNLGVLCPSQFEEDCRVPKGDHMGSYFGHTLACGDLNNDSYDDLIIAAPYHSDTWARIHDVGKVKIFFGKPSEDHYGYFPEFEEVETAEIFGNQTDHGLFGYSLNVQGDLNFDGIPDLVVGAPYEDNGQGAVYIFNGGSGSFDTRYSQRITPSQLREPLRGFGSSISSGYNIDKIGGDELAVGSFLSDTVVSMRTIPTIDITPTLLLLHEVVNLETASYEDPGTGVLVVGNTLRINISTIGTEFPEKTLQLNWRLVLDPVMPDPVDKRAYVRPARNGSDMFEVRGRVVLEANKEVTLDEIVHVLLKRERIRSIKDIYVDIEGTLEVLQSPENFSSKQGLKYELFRQARLPIVIDTDCNKNTGTCTSDIEITRFETAVQSDLFDSLIINHVEYLNLLVRLTNNGPDKAYGTSFLVTLPTELSLDSVRELQADVECGEGTLRLDCPDNIRMNNSSCSNVLSPVDSNSITITISTNDSTIECQVDGPLNPGYRDITFRLLVNNTRLTHKEPISLQGSISASSPSEDPYLDNNSRTSSLIARHLADIKVEGGPGLDTQIFMNSLVPEVFDRVKEWGDIGPEVVHSLSVTINEMIYVESVRDIELSIAWPLKRGGNHVLYITDIYIPEPYRDMICCDRSMVDVDNLKPAATSPPNTTHLPDFCPTTPSLARTSQSVSSTERTSQSEGSTEQLFGYGETAVYDCRTEPCYVIKCVIPELRRGVFKHSHVRFEVRSRLWERTFNNNHRVEVTSHSKVVAVGGGLVLPVARNRNRPITSKFILPNKRKALNLTVILLSALAGLFIVLIIFIILWKKGFFESGYFKRTPHNMFQTGSRRDSEY